ncbi:MAG: ribonuclease III [Robiginitomaculum sp.]|nr:MAG: ribonuclease III [Robiginitomaculum sp.]
MSQTPNLLLPYILEAQAQKHVTHNEAIRALDALVQLVMTSQSLTAPPAAPLEGERYIVGTSAPGVWAGKDTQIAAWQDGAWAYYMPQSGWRAWITDQALMVYFDGTDWQSLLRGPDFIANISPMGAQSRFELLEEEVTLVGPFTDSTIMIPDRAIVFGVSTRTLTAITGANSYDCGLSTDSGQYGSALGIAPNSTNSGVTNATAFYADTPIRLSANTADFTGGTVRVAIHFMRCLSPTS